MTDSTVNNLGVLPAGLQATDLFYVVRPGSPDADFKAAGSDLSAFVATLGYVPASRTVNGHALSGNIAVTKSDIGLGGVENTALSSWAGTANITTLGTVITGTWHGTAIADGYISSASAWNAKIGGTTGSTDNQLLRADGTGGGTAQASGITVSDNNEIAGFLTTLNAQTGTTYTLAATDTGKTVTLNNASAVTVTLPNSLAAGFTCECVQLGAGQVTFSAASGATLNNRQSQVKIAGQHGAARLTVTANSDGSHAVYNLAGDTGA